MSERKKKWLKELTEKRRRGKLKIVELKGHLALVSLGLQSAVV